MEAWRLGTLPFFEFDAISNSEDEGAMKNGNGNIDPAELKKKADGLSSKAATLQSSITMLESQLAQVRQQHHQEIERSLRGEKCRADAYRSEADLVTAKIATLKGQLSQVEDERGKILCVLYAEQERQQCEAEREQLADLEATFESAMRSLFNGEPSSLSVSAASSGQEQSAAASATKPSQDLNSLVSGAAQDLAAYQRLTAQGKLAEAGQKLEDLKRKLDQLNARQK